MCEFGAPWQKTTTLLFTPGLDPWLNHLRSLSCSHSSHGETAGGEQLESGEWNSKGAAAYPPAFNLFLAKALRSAACSRPLLSSPRQVPSRPRPR
jgi:hypothetical protein